MTQSSIDSNNDHYLNGYNIYKTQFNHNNINYNNKILTVEWDNGEKSDYHFLWFRDNCKYGGDVRDQSYLIYRL